MDTSSPTYGVYMSMPKSERLMVVVAAYLLWLGAQAPGGAFQGGAVLGAVGVLLLLTGLRPFSRVPGWALRIVLVVGFVVFLAVAINLKMIVALYLSGFFLHTRWWIKVLAVLFILPWAVPSIPTILSVRFMLNPEWGVINSTYFRLTGLDGPNWLNDPTLALTFAMLMHIWKSLPFWTLILLAGRMAIPAEQYEAASVDGASNWQKFRYITWPSMRGLYLTCTLLSTIWTLGDFNSVYLLTGGGPADLTHVLATLGIRYLRLDQIELAMAAIVVSLPLVLPIVYFMMKRLSK